MTDQQTPTPQWINDKGEGVAFGGGAEPKPDDVTDYRRIDVIAELGWQSHIAWERIIGEQPKPDWSALSPGQKVAIVDSVRWLIDHPTSSVAAQHDAWRARNYDVTHPNMVPFDDLPFSQQMKARLWRHIIFAVLG
jgi:hypothetical protein